MRQRILAVVFAAVVMVMPAMGQSFDLGGLLSKLTGKTELTVANMAGEWKYASPAVSFKSDNLLKKAGGTAASVAVEKKLEPYYSKVGFTNLTMEVAEDSTFTMKIKKLSLKGQIAAPEEGSDANFTFRFMIGGKIKAADMDAYVTLSGDDMDITFDVSKLVTLMELVGKVSGNSTVKATTSLLKAYDGITAGFTLKRVSK